MKQAVRRASAFATAVLMALALVAGVIPTGSNVVTALAASEKKLNVGEIKEGAISSNSEVGAFTLTSGSEIDANTKTLDNGMEITKRLKLGGAGSISSRSIVFETEGPAVVTAYCMSSGDSERILALFNDAGEVISEQPAKATYPGNILTADTYDITEAGKYYLASKASGINVYYVSVNEGEQETIERDPWSSVASPVLGTATAADGTITVTYTMKIGARVADACDQMVVTMYDEKGTKVSDVTVGAQGESGKVEFTPTASGKYTFKAEAIRKAETDAKTSNEVSTDFTLPLSTPVVRAMTTDTNGGMQVTWGAVPEAEEYDVSYKLSTAEEYGEVTNVKAGTTAELSTHFAGLTKGSKYDFKVVAKRGTDVSEDGVAKEFTVRSEAERDWIGTRFGTSTSDEANRYEGNVYDGLKLYSCTYKDNGTISKKGGKLNASDPYDGITYYYTKIDPKTENFELTGTFTIDYINPSPDGQEGFGIIIRDSVGKDGDASGAYYTNSATAIASKVQYTNDDGETKSIKDGIGYRFYSGVTSTTETPKTGQVTVNSGAFDTKTQIKQGDSYTFTVKMDNTGYRVIYKDSQGNENVQTLYGRDELLVIDKENVYVGFAAARGCNVTVKDIKFTTSNPSTDAPDEGKPVEAVASDYKISSPSTSGSTSYNFTFSANADGKLTVKKGSKTIANNVDVKAGEDYVSQVKLSVGDNNFTAEFTPNADYKPGDNMEMDSYEKTTVEKTVSCRPIGNPGEKIIVSPDGTSDGKGTSDSPLDIRTALQYVQAGQHIVCQAGTYELREALKIESGIDGTKEQRIYLYTDPESSKPAVFDFMQEGKGMVLWGDYWYIKGISITRSADGQKGLQVAGSNNVIEQVRTYANGNTGLQISGQSTDPFEKWPANNLILNCTSYENCDEAMEDADGFAAKLTTGEGNVFYGCLAYNNADDGWDCFAKTATGSIGAVTVINSIAFKNGYLLNGTEAGNGNGFKMGGSALSGHHVLKNCIAYDNKAKGIDSNSCPDIEVYNCTSYNNKSYNVALYSNTGITTAFKAEGIISYKDLYTDVAEQIKVSGQEELSTTTNYFWTEIAAANAKEKKGNTPNEDWFESVKTSVTPGRNDDGTLNVGKMLKTSSKAPANAGADFDNEEYSMDKILAQFEVSRDIPEVGEVTAAKTGGNTTVYVVIAVVVVVVVIAIVAVVLGKKKKNAKEVKSA
jgi:hypothetical protein